MAADLAANLIEVERGGVDGVLKLIFPYLSQLNIISNISIIDKHWAILSKMFNTELFLLYNEILLAKGGNFCLQIPWIYQTVREKTVGEKNVKITTHGIH